MKVQVKRLFVVLTIIAVALVVSLICYTQLTVWPIQEKDGEILSIQSVSVGNAEVTDSFDLSAVVEVLRSCSGKRQVGAVGRIDLDDTIVLIDGRDADGPVHFVLNQTKGIFYRSAQDGYLILDNAVELYDAIWVELP